MAVRRTVGGLLGKMRKAVVYAGAQHHNEGHYAPPYHHQYQYSDKDPPHLPVVWATKLAYMRSPVWSSRLNYSTQAAPASEDPMGVCQEESQAIPTQDLSSKETRKLLKLIKVDDFKKLLHSTGQHCLSLEEILKLCKQTGAAITDAEAEELVKNLDEAGVVLIFRNRVFLEPDKVADLLAKTMPFYLAAANDPRTEELAKLQREKEEIDKIAHKQVRRMLWGALGAFSVQSLIFFRLTFWDLSWDVMEPITFFVTSSSLLAGFFFFVMTQRDPSYQDLMRTLLSNKQEKLIKKRGFNMERFKQLQVQCCMPPLENQPHANHY